MLGRGARMRTLALAAFLGAAVLASGLGAPARGAEGALPVSIELVLAIDASLSVDDWEFGLQLRGIAEALRRPEIVALVGQHVGGGGVAVALVQWSGWAESQPSPPWRLLTDAASVRAYADELAKLSRSGTP